MSFTYLSHPKYRRDIDGLRAIAVFSVVIFHAFPNLLKGGFIGVDIFFVISGYLISTIIFENLETKTFSFIEFYVRRIKRIFPALILVLISCFIFGWFALLADEYKQLGKHIVGGSVFVSNFVLLNESGYFDNSVDTKPLLHLWSLGVEEQFYIVWPLLLWIAYKNRLNLFSVGMLVAIVSFYLNVRQISVDNVKVFYSPQTRFWELMSGSILAWLKLYRPGLAANSPGRLDRWLGWVIYGDAYKNDGKAMASTISVLGLLLLIYGFCVIDKNVVFPGKWALVPVLGSIFIIFAGTEAWVNRVILSGKVIVWFGLISFPLYLWHWPLLSFARIVENEDPDWNIRISIVLLSIILAWLTCKIIERPLRFGKHGSAKTAILLFLMAATGYAGYDIYMKDGLSSRFSTNLVMDDGAIAAERSKYWAVDLASNYQAAQKKIVIFGDSQGFDIYKALKNNNKLGLKIFQVDHECTAFNLPKKGAEVKTKSCQDSFDKFISSEELVSANVLIYSFFWSSDLENESALVNYRKVLDRVKSINPKIKIIFFGPKPLLGTKWISINAIVRTRKSVLGMNEFLNSIKWIRADDIKYAGNLAERLNVDFVDVSNIFCNHNCQFYLDDKFTYFDQNHWTEFGANLFYQKLQDLGDNPVLQ